MNLTFLTYGTEGDTRPLVAIARALQEQGHQVHLLADRATAGTAQSHGIAFTPLAGDIRQTLSPQGALGKLVRQGGNVEKITRAFATIASDHTVEWMAAAREIAAGSDVMVFSGLASYAGLAVAEGLDIPCLGAGLWPMTPTGDFPSVFLRPRQWPRWLNRLSHRAFAHLAWTAFRPNVNRGRRQLFGQPARKKAWQGYPILYGCSPTLVPRPHDWPAEATLCGAWHLGDTGWQAPEGLQRFLDEGEPPIYIGFGSMAGFDTGSMRRALVDAVGARRAVLYPGWSGIDLSGLPSNVHVIGDTPHDWLFPRMSVIVHHGGAGTTHAAARAGVPAVVLPFAGDQFFWADRVERLGIASVCRASARVDAATLRALIAQAGGTVMRAHARTVAQRMAGENGTLAAQRAILGGGGARLSSPT